MNVVGLAGALPKVREPNEKAVQTLQMMLEQAKAGEIVGVAVIALHYDGLGSYRIGGCVGGYSMLGAMQAANMSLLHIVEEID